MTWGMRTPPVSPGAEHQQVPRIFHQMWLGPDIPQLAQENWTIWDEALDDTWTIVRWDQEAVDKHPVLQPMVTALRESDVSWRAVTDVARLWILLLHGGVYMDCDAYPAGDITTLAECPAWVGQRPGRIEWSLCNGFFGSPQGHPYVAEILSCAAQQANKGVKLDHWFAGPVIMWKAYRQLPAASRPDLRRETTSMVGGHLLDVLHRGATYDRDRAATENPGKVVIHP